MKYTNYDDAAKALGALMSLDENKNALDGVQDVQFSIGTKNHFAIALESEPLDNGYVAVSVCSTAPFLRHQSGTENNFCDFYLYNATLIFEPPILENDKFQFCCATFAEIEEIKSGEKIVVFPPDDSNDFSAPSENMQKAFKRTCLSYLNKDFVPNENIQNALNQAYTEYTKQAEAKADYTEYDQEDEQEQDTDFDLD